MRALASLPASALSIAAATRQLGPTKRALFSLEKKAVNGRRERERELQEQWTSLSRRLPKGGDSQKISLSLHLPFPEVPNATANTTSE